MNRTEAATFTTTAAKLVAANDRRAHRRALLASLRRAAERVGIGWGALVVAAFVLVILPVNMRMS